MKDSNGKQPLTVAPRLRWIWYGGSILSTRGNPLVATHRLVIRELLSRGQEVEYLEPAGHPAFIEGLNEDGSSFYRSFLEEFPDIRYRRYDMPRAHERDVWMSREAALTDVVIIESGAPPEVFSWLTRVEERSFVRLLLADSIEADGGLFDEVFAPDSETSRYAAVMSPADVADQVDRLMRTVSAIRVRQAAEKSRR